VTAVLTAKNASIRRLRKLLFGLQTEKTDQVVDHRNGAPAAGNHAGAPGISAPAEASGGSAGTTPSPSKGHGRNGAGAYHGATQIDVRHGSLELGDPCPDCGQGSTLYEVTQPGVLVRVVGQVPLQATVYRLQKLRCNLCGKVFTAPAPPGTGPRKYDATAATMIALLKYGSGLPFNRLDRLQGTLEIPLAVSTQWDIVQRMAGQLRPIYGELIRQAAQGDVLHNDDTTVKILDLMGRRARQRALAEGRAESSGGGVQRTGLFTTGIVSRSHGHRIALFFSGHQHAGENLKDVLAQRQEDLEPPIQMCDALARNLPGELKTIVANCLAHGRRRFVDVVPDFPEACRHVLDALKVVYRNDAIVRRRTLTPEERLQFHQAESGPTIEALYEWLNRQFDERLVEPNSGLGEAISYMRKHWLRLTLFLRKAGAPLDNNICERALKKVILHRKNALFFRSENGARVGDLFMSLIYTCECCGVNPFNYLTQLQRHSGQLALHPESWLPWNYRAALQAPQAAA